MGDRTHVTLRILKEDETAVRKICEEADYAPDDAIPDPFLTDDLVDLYFDEVNYGDLPFLTTLEDAGIPFDSDWAEGGNYGAGTYYCRYDENGEHVPVELHDHELSIEITDLMGRIHDYNDLVAFIRRAHFGVQTLPWDNQAHNAKLFRTKQLITQ